MTTLVLLRSPVVIAAMMVVVAAGCSRPGARELTGTWKLVPPGELLSGSDISGENDSALADSDDDTIAGNTRALFNSMSDRASQGGITLVFHRNGLLETITDFPAASSHKRWRWSLDSWDAEQRVAVVRCEMSLESVTTTIRFLDADTIRLIPPNIAVLEKELQFHRQ